ncbi:UDP-N-acetyl-D-mannosamine dehydrogenase [Alsobacter soli]|uniref:UDP-N-acetyl-D-mannosamine dehydrogenase n=1 Tax=Alsobacter soli TaxID=2109933 RepID=A0A2T1HWQ9_9HYPH|nr:UDP-N-acetyl-D-mannosamine dehydrogenase [Alsobacter soli]PSC06111.1 UDP-N-acetyl-D-mannosamine dehydrogenase [Alsobacter soli]
MVTFTIPQPTYEAPDRGPAQGSAGLRAIETVSVIGLGYVGLPTAALLASRGLKVIGVDLKQDAVARINEGRAHIAETDLDMILDAVVKGGKLQARTSPLPADAFLIAVPTPITADKKADMRAVEAALASIAPVLKRGDLIVIESTSPVGTTERAAAQLRSLRPDLRFPDAAPEQADVFMAYCPERILPGQTLRELVDNARIIGGLDHASALRAREVYAHFARGKMMLATSREAECAKLAENAFRDVNIAFANELATLCEGMGVDPWAVIRMANLHPRVNILSPGPGVGGHCIPIDPWFLHHAMPEQTPLIAAARGVNDGKPLRVANRVQRLASRFKEPVIAVLGLAYKPNVDDLRESPAVEIARTLADRGVGRLLIAEPNIARLPHELAGRPDVQLVEGSVAVAEADIVTILVAHSRFRNLDRAALASRVVVDTVGLLKAEQA